MNVHSVLARATYRQVYLSFFCHQKMPNERESDRLRSVICIIPTKVHTDMNIPDSSSAVLAFASGTTCLFTKTCSVLSKIPMHDELLFTPGIKTCLKWTDETNHHLDMVVLCIYLWKDFIRIFSVDCLCFLHNLLCCVLLQLC